MIVNGFTTVMGGSLACSVEGADWHFSIRRVDNKSHSNFYELHKKEVLPAHIASYVPNWKQLLWTKIPDSMLSKSESYAKDTELRVNVMSTEKGGKTHDEVVGAFLAFMGEA